jgi:uncharacterized protein (TIGR03089 family)
MVRHGGILPLRTLLPMTPPSPVPRTFPDLLASVLHSAPAQPLVTFYDDASGERVELSATTYTNWVAKTAGLVQDELDVEHGALALVDLPTHWLGAVWLGALLSGGQVVTTDIDLVEEVDLVVCGPDGVKEYAGRADVVPVVALSLRPLGARFADPLPTGVVDYGAVVLGQPDAFLPLQPPTPDDAAWCETGRALSQAELLAEASDAPLVEQGGRLLTDVNPCTPEGRGTLLSPLLLGGGTVWSRHADRAGWPRRYDEERATAQLRASRP